MGQRSSVATIDKPEFINVQSVSRYIAKCQIKVLYIGENRNNSVISKEVATKMAQTLPGCPIVGWYKEDVDDFRDHGNVIKIEENKIKMEKKTRPFGFIPPNAKVWFQFFEDTDEFGNITLREYLVTEGYLWTQFEGGDLPIEDGGRPQSMELDEETLQGRWTIDVKRDKEFFIINDAELKSLCILGKDVEPCYEGSNITPTVTFSNENFALELKDMLQQLQFTLNKLEGGQKMAVIEEKIADKTDETKTVESQFKLEDEKKKEENTDKKDDSTSKEDSSTKKEDPKNDDEDQKKKDVANNALKDDEKKDEPTKEDKSEKDSKSEKKDDDEKDKKNPKDYSLLEQKYEDLMTEFTALKASYEGLVDFKNQVEDKEKDKMIASFYMLDDEDKKDVIANKSEYTLDEIESKLSVICVRKKVNFDLDKEVESEKEAPAMYSLDGLKTEATQLPAWLRAVEANKNKNK